MVLVNLWDVIERRYGLNHGWGKLLIGVGLFVLGLYSITFSGGRVVITAGFILGGAWVTLDSIYNSLTGYTAFQPDSLGRFAYLSTDATHHPRISHPSERL